MRTEGITALVTGGASGLGLATAQRLVDRGANVVITDLASSSGPEAAKGLGERAVFAPADVTDEGSVNAALDAAERFGPLRAVVNCAGIGPSGRVLGKQGPLALEDFRRVIEVNLVGTFNVLRLAAARMAANEPLDGDRGVVVMTASVAAFDGQIGQAAYTASKAGIAGLTLCAARDLASRAIRVTTIAPGTFDTPMLATVSEEFRASLSKQVPHPSRLGQPAEYAALVCHIVENAMLNGETIRLDGAIRMPPR